MAKRRIKSVITPADLPSRPPTAAGPFVTAAVICERVLIEQDGVLSAIRVIDRMIVPLLAPLETESQQNAPTYPFNLLVSAKAGGFEGRANFTATSRAPSGRTMINPLGEAAFGPLTPGVNFVVQSAMQPREEGIYWFEIRCNDTILTQTPLEIKLASDQLGASTIPAPPQR